MPTNRIARVGQALFLTTFPWLLGCAEESTASREPVSGAAPAAGGSRTTGGAQGLGGSTTTGGVVVSGGVPATPATGGTGSTGVSAATGGVPSAGGFVVTGGLPATGGYVATGGLPTTGGVDATGGAVNTGGSLTVDDPLSVINVRDDVGPKGPIADDAFGFQYASLVVGEGETERVTIRYATLLPRWMRVELVRDDSKVAAALVEVPAGRGSIDLGVVMPADLANATDYLWIGSLLDAPNDGTVLDRKEIAGVEADDVAVGSGSIAPNHPYLQYVGRTDLTNLSAPEFIWQGSYLVARFEGSSVSADIETGGSDSEWHRVSVAAMIDQDPTTFRRIELVPGVRATIQLASGLGDGAHSLQLMRDAEAVFPYVLHGLNLDAGRGLLRPRSLADLKVAVFGDSVATGGGTYAAPGTTPDPNGEDGWDDSAFLAFGALVGRALPAQVHIASKGGTGVARSFVLDYVAKDYMSLWHFNTWSPKVMSPGSSWEPANDPWDHAAWQADVVLVEYGQNDAGMGVPDGEFIAAYVDFLTRARAAHPNAHLVALSGLMVFCCAQRENIVSAVQQFGDPRTHVLAIPCDPSIGGSHPHADQHAAAVWSDGGILDFLHSDVLPDPVAAP